MGKKTGTKNTVTAAAVVPAVTATNVAAGKEGGKRRKKANMASFETYIYKVLKQTYPELGVSRKSMIILDSFCTDIFERVCTEASHLARYNKKHTMSVKDVQTAVRLVIPGDLAKHAVSNGIKSVTAFNNSSTTTA